MGMFEPNRHYKVGTLTCERNLKEIMSIQDVYIFRNQRSFLHKSTPGQFFRDEM